MSAGMRSGGIGVGRGSIYGAFERKEDARSRDRSSARTFWWPGMCSAIIWIWNFCFRKEEAAQQVHKLLISAVARVDYCNHSRVITPSQNGGALPRLTPSYGSEYNGD